MRNLTPGFIVAHSHRLQDLTDLVVSLNRQYPLPPLANEAILVQSNGIAQWLKQHVAAGLGIAAMMDVMLPARFQWQAYRAVLGNDLPRHSPFDKDRLTWRLMRVLPEHLNEPEFATLKRYMSDDRDARKCFQLCERLADLYDQYQVYRADWLSDWAAGGATNVPADQQWQPLLWRYVLADVGNEQWNNRALLHQRFVGRCEQLTVATRPAQLPPRVIVFGISSLPKQSLEVLRALSRFTQVVLCVHNPCQYYWADIIDGKDIYTNAVKPRQQRRHAQTLDAEQLHTAAHPLLASWGKQGRDYIRLLDQFDETESLRSAFPSLKLDLFDHELPQQPSVLDALRYDILHLNSPDEAKQQWQDVALRDEAIQFHIAHSPQREVEILHDQLLAQFAAQPNLRPRDVMVMVPDIDRYAPHIEAVFGRLDRDDSRYIPYSLADQSARHQHPMLIALEYALTIHQQRGSASELFDLLQVDAIAQRFGLSADKLPQLQRWVDGAGVRWGLNANHRKQLDLPSSTTNSWLFGLQRMLLGYALGDSEHLQSDWCGIEPFADVGGLDADMVGGLQQFVNVLITHANQANQARTPNAWASYLTAFLAQLYAPEDDADMVLLNRLHQRLQQWLEATQSAELALPISLTVVLESWLAGVDEGNLNQRFMAGNVNFATLMPMRAIPFKCVCLLGMNDGDYPRSQKPFDFDLMATFPRPGDRSRREDDRYLFLEAVLSAQQHLHISWQGRSIRDNSEKPPAVVVSQLIEHLNRVYGQRANGKSWTVEHRLQPFHADYFIRDQAQAQQLFSFAQEWHVVHQSSHGSVSNTSLVSAPKLAPYIPEQPLSVTNLVDFFKEPAKLFTRTRWQTYLPKQSNQLRDDETFALDQLAHWLLLDELFNIALPTLLAGGSQNDAAAHLQAALDQLQRAGEIPQGAAGISIKQALAESTDLVFERVAELRANYPDPVPVTQVQYQHPNGCACEATFQNLRVNEAGQWLNLHITPSIVVEGKRPPQVRPKYAVRAWIEHLLLCTQNATLTTVLGREGVLCFNALSSAQATAYLERLLAWVADGLQRPLAVEFETAFAGLKAIHKNWQVALSSEFEVTHPVAGGFYDDGGYNSAAQKRKAIYAARFFPDYAALCAGEDQQPFAEQLYRPFLAALVEGSDASTEA